MGNPLTTSIIVKNKELLSSSLADEKPDFDDPKETNEIQKLNKLMHETKGEIKSLIRENDDK